MNEKEKTLMEFIKKEMEKGAADVACAHLVEEEHNLFQSYYRSGFISLSFIDIRNLESKLRAYCNILGPRGGVTNSGDEIWVMMLAAYDYLKNATPDILNAEINDEETNKKRLELCMKEGWDPELLYAGIKALSDTLDDYTEKNFKRLNGKAVKRTKIQNAAQYIAKVEETPPTSESMKSDYAKYYGEGSDTPDQWQRRWQRSCRFVENVFRCILDFYLEDFGKKFPEYCRTHQNA